MEIIALNAVQGWMKTMAEYIYEIESHEDNESEIFIGWIRNHSQELIRCKDCNKDGTSKCAMAYWDMQTGEITAWNRPFEYCSRGEKK